MLSTLAVIVVILLVISAAAVVGPRIGVAAPLVLVLTGLAVSLVPRVPQLQMNPDFILQGLLPPLLYAAAVAMPPISFRREFKTVSGLSVLLVIVSSLLLGLVFHLLIPGLGFAWGAALGAIFSPTDAAATSIVKRGGVPRRAIVVLEGESLLNDATALVLLRTAIVAAIGSFSLWAALGTFVYSVVVAIVIGAAVGWLMLSLRRWISDPTVATIVSFTVPFVASIPAEMLEASGLVSAVVAGLVTSFRGPHVLPPQHRLSDRQTWASVALVLEGLIFATMGLELTAILGHVSAGDFGLVAAVGVAAIGLAAVLVVRAVYIFPVLWGLSRNARRFKRLEPELADMSDQVEQAVEAGEELRLPPGVPSPPGRIVPAIPPKLPPIARKITGDEQEQVLSPQQAKRLGRRIRKSLADIDYVAKEPLGRREGVVVVWAGMRGAVTVATAQTLPLDAPHRSFLVLVAFFAALMSLLVQGLTVGPLTKWLYRNRPAHDDPKAAAARRDEQRKTVREILQRAGDEAGDIGRLDLLSVQRQALLNVRAELPVDPEVLDDFLRLLDAEQIELEMLSHPLKLDDDD